MKAREGDTKAFQTLVQSKIRHALAIGASFDYPNRDDLGEFALYALVRAIDSFIRNGKDTNLDPYITFVVRKEVGRALFEERIIRLNKTTAWRHKKKGTFDKLNVMVGSFTEVQEEIVTLVKSLSPKVAMKLVVNQDPDLDLRDSINRVIASSDNPEEMQQILELRIRGCSDEEVAKQIDKSKSYVALRRNELLYNIQKELQ